MELKGTEVIENSYTKCVGCGACKNICPKNAITMKLNDEGFYYPEIDKEKCINCHLCHKTCPAINNNLKKDESKVYAYCTSNINTWISSTSGGAFTDICNIWEKEYPGSHYYGAAMMNDHTIMHICVDFKNLYKIRKSKYSQSNIGDSYKSVKKDLDKGIGVVFSGTPCQVAGLKNFLHKEYEKLLSIDVVCHGVGSNEVLKDCIKLIETNANKKISNYNFRYKKEKDFKPYKRYNVEYVYEDGTRIENNNDLYINLFLSGKCLRNSCSKNCRFKACNSYSDITLADLNNKSRIIPNIYDKRNYSAIFFHSNKSYFFLDKLDEYGRFIECNEAIVVKYNKVYYTNNDCKNNRDAFFREYKKNKLSNIGKEQSEKIIRKSITDYIPYFIKYAINNIKRRNKNG